MAENPEDRDEGGGFFSDESNGSWESQDSGYISIMSLGDDSDDEPHDPDIVLQPPANAPANPDNADADANPNIPQAHDHDEVAQIDIHANLNPFTLIEDTIRYYRSMGIKYFINSRGNLGAMCTRRNGKEYVTYVNKRSGLLVKHYPDSKKNYCRAIANWRLADLPLEDLLRR